MILRIILIFVALLIIVSCANKKINGSNKYILSEPPCGGNVDDFEKVNTYNSESTFQIYAFIQNTDTIKVDELICTDSINFRQAFKDISAPEFCVELNYQGNTYYSVTIDSTGAFENFRILRKVDQCYDSFDNGVELKLKNLYVLSDELFDSELIFYHQFRIY